MPVGNNLETLSQLPSFLMSHLSWRFGRGPVTACEEVIMCPLADAGMVDVPKGIGFFDLVAISQHGVKDPWDL